jgi:hypothetical protein
VTGDLKIKGPVREIGIVRDSERHESFNITIGIAIKTEGKITYEEAERLSAKYRREYLGKDVEFLAVSIPCPVCGKVLNSESGVKMHLAKSHHEKVELINPPKIAAKEEAPEKTIRRRKNVEESTKGKETKRKRKTKTVKTRKTVKTQTTGKTTKAEKPKVTNSKHTKPGNPPPERLKAKEETKPAILETPQKSEQKKQQSKARQMTLA